MKEFHNSSGYQGCCEEPSHASPHAPDAQAFSSHAEGKNFGEIGAPKMDAHNKHRNCEQFAEDEPNPEVVFHNVVPLLF